MFLLFSNIILDDEIESFIKKIVTKLCGNAKSCPPIYILNDKTPNAGVNDLNQIIVYSGLITKCRNINEFVGVMAHEMGHLKAHHTSLRFSSPAPLALGAGLGTLAVCAPLGIMMLASSQHVHMHETLRQMRYCEMQADNYAITILKKLNWPSDGIFTFLKTLESYTHENHYLRTHPKSQERLSNLERQMSSRGAIPYGAEFERVQNKLKGYVHKDYALTDPYAQSVQSFAKRDFTHALNRINQCLAKKPKDPYYLELKGDIYFAQGAIDDALSMFEQAQTILPSAHYIALKYVCCLIEKRQLEKARAFLHRFVLEHKDSPHAWYLLGKTYHMLNMPSNAVVCRIEEARLLGNTKQRERLMKQTIQPETQVFQQRLRDLRAK